MLSPLLLKLSHHPRVSLKEKEKEEVSIYMENVLECEFYSKNRKIIMSDVKSGILVSKYEYFLLLTSRFLKCSKIIYQIINIDSSESRKYQTQALSIMPSEVITGWKGFVRLSFAASLQQNTVHHKFKTIHEKVLGLCTSMLWIRSNS